MAAVPDINLVPTVKFDRIRLVTPSAAAACWPKFGMHFTYRPIAHRALATSRTRLRLLRKDGERLRRRVAGFQLQKPRVEQPLGIEIAHGGQDILLQVRIFALELGEHAAQR